MNEYVTASSHVIAQVMYVMKCYLLYQIVPHRSSSHESFIARVKKGRSIKHCRYLWEDSIVIDWAVPMLHT
jgi:hypothetical protein